MRKCIRCGEDMLENYVIKTQSRVYGIRLKSDGDIVFGKNVGEPRAAICPNCGEISFYLDNLSKLNK